MKTFSKVLSATAALTLTFAPVAASASDVRPGDARIDVSSLAVSGDVRADASQAGNKAKFVRGTEAWILAFAAAIAAGLGIWAAVEGADNATSP